MIKPIHQAIDTLRSSVGDDEKRYQLQFLWVYRILAAVSLGMSAVNVFTHKYELMISTLAFFVLCLLCLFLAKKSKKGLTVSSWLFAVSFVALFSFFIISGTPEGFSAIWICMLPSCGLLLFGRKRGTALCAVMLAVMLFFFQYPPGVFLLQYEYTDSFRLRFPMLYAAFFAVSFLLETIRVLTQRELVKAQEKYRYLYAHDALTGLYNRHGFNEHMTKTMENGGGAALLIADIDRFKAINDVWGHVRGDTVLMSVADTIKSIIGEEGTVCRWGGEEFAVLLQDVRKTDKAAHDIVNTLRKTPISLDGKNVFVTVSVGALGVENTKKISATDMVQRTDQCLYQAKETGRDRAVIEHITEEAN